MSENKPFWYPKLCDENYIKRIREEYDCDKMSDGDILTEFANGKKYATTWDHIGDAYEDFEPLADAFLRLEKENEELKAKLEQAIKRIEEIKLNHSVPHRQRVFYTRTTDICNEALEKLK